MIDDYAEKFIEYEYIEEIDPTPERVAQLDKQGWRCCDIINGTRYIFSRAKRTHQYLPGRMEFKA